MMHTVNHVTKKSNNQPMLTMFFAIVCKPFYIIPEVYPL